MTKIKFEKEKQRMKVKIKLNEDEVFSDLERKQLEHI